MDTIEQTDNQLDQAPVAKPRGRPRAFDQDEALDRALNVFWTRGYEGASLNELTEALGINRPSLYAAFGNKEALFRKALGRYLEGPVSYAMQAINAPTVREVVRTFLVKSVELTTSGENPPGCMMVVGALACGEGSEVIRQELIVRRNNYLRMLAERFERAKLEGDLPASVSASDLARYVTTIHQGLSVQATSGATRNELMGVVNLVMQSWPSA